VRMGSTPNLRVFNSEIFADEDRLASADDVFGEVDSRRDASAWACAQRQSFRDRN